MNETRLNRVRDLLAERQLDGAIISHPSNRYYLSGYTGEDTPPDETAGLLLIDTDHAVLMTSATNALWAEAEADGFEVIAWARPWEEKVGKQISAMGWRAVGFEPAAMTVATHEALTAALNGTTLRPLGDAVERLRRVKDAEELAALEAVIRLTDEVFVAATAELAPGMTERALAWTIERTMRERGADGPSFPTIVAAGPHGARPHHRPTDRPIEPSEPIIIDMGASLNGYQGDLTRTIWIGEPTPRLRELYDLVDRAQQAALHTIRAGISGKEADAAARDVFAAADLEEEFGHGLGHGIGVRVHEGPSMGKTSEDTLAAGEVVTIEPGVYLPDWGGIRIEDVGVVELEGIRVLTTAPKHHFTGGRA